MTKGSFKARTSPKIKCDVTARISIGTISTVAVRLRAYF